MLDIGWHFSVLDVTDKHVIDVRIGIPVIQKMFYLEKAVAR